MTRAEKRKQPVDRSKLFVGATVYVWDGYPYRVNTATIIRDTKIHWVCCNGKKYVKSTCNESGFCGLAGNFIEPITKESEDAVHNIRLRNTLYSLIRHHMHCFHNNTLEAVIELLKDDIKVEDDSYDA